jgi:hypothetical protein
MPISAYAPPGHNTDLTMRGLNLNGAPQGAQKPTAQAPAAGTPAANAVATPNGQAFIKRANEACGQGGRFAKRRVLSFDSDRTHELRHVAKDGKVTRDSKADDTVLQERLEEHKGRVIIRNPDGTTRYMFERQDADGNFHPDGEWRAFDGFGKAVSPSSPAEMIVHLVNTSPAGLHFSSYYMNSVDGVGFGALDGDRRSLHQDVGVESRRDDIHRDEKDVDGADTLPPSAHKFA